MHEDKTPASQTESGVFLYLMAGLAVEERDVLIQHSQTSPITLY